MYIWDPTLGWVMCGPRLSLGPVYIGVGGGGSGCNEFSCVDRDHPFGRVYIGFEWGSAVWGMYILAV